MFQTYITPHINSLYDSTSWYVVGWSIPTWNENRFLPLNYYEITITVLILINHIFCKLKLEKTGGTIKNGQSRDIGNTGYTRQNMTTSKIKHATQYVLDTTMCKQIKITQIRHEPSDKQLDVKTTRTSFLCGKHNGHNNTEVRK